MSDVHYNLRFEFRCRCKDCGTELSGEFSHTNKGKAVLHVEPCYKCANAEFIEGKKKGFDDGYSNGYSVGISLISNDSESEEK